MKRRILYLTVAIALLAARAVSATDQTDVVDSAPPTVLDLQGTIGKDLAVHMHLEIRDVVRHQGTDSFVVGERYSGYYAYDKHGGRIGLIGYFNAQGPGGAVDDPRIEIGEYTDGKKTGTFSGSLGEHAFKGRWQALGSGRSLPFQLRITATRGPKR